MDKTPLFWYNGINHNPNNYTERKVFCLNSTLPSKYSNVKKDSLLTRFFNQFELKQLLKDANFKKVKGISLFTLVVFISQLVFHPKNLFQYLKDDTGDAPCDKDTVYRLLNDPRNDWRKLLLFFAGAVIRFYRSLTSDKRVCALAIDDSAYYRDRSKKVELLARVKDHVGNRYFKGFRKLTAGWTDGASFVATAFALLSSTEAKNRLYEQGPDVPINSPGMLRRNEAIKKSTEVALDLVKETLSYINCFDYVLFDSWFSWPSLIQGIKNLHIDVICRLKDMPTLFYIYQGKQYRLSDLFAVVCPNRKYKGKKEVIASVIVEYYGISARIVFVSKWNSKKGERDWIALFSTNTEISDEEIIRTYGLRWDIEVYFKVCKSFLRLAKEYQGRSYDLLVSHTSIVCIRHMFLGFNARESIDSRSHGGLFYQCCDEVKDIDFQQAFLLILDLLVATLREELFLSQDEADKLLNSFIERIPNSLKERLGLEAA